MKLWHERIVTYYTEDPAKEYIGSLDWSSQPALVESIKPWSRLAHDALEQAESLTDFDGAAKLWKLRRQERHGVKCATTIGAILLPSVMLRVSMVTIQFHAPWGTAFIRCRELGAIVLNGDHWEATK